MIGGRHEVGTAVADEKKPQTDLEFKPKAGSYVMTGSPIAMQVKARTGTKKRRVEVLSGQEFSKSTGRVVDKTRTIDKSDRSNMRIRERVVVPETGEVLRDVDEPLREHTGRGAAKFKKPAKP
jgi:hypothetical protein